MKTKCCRSCENKANAKCLDSREECPQFVQAGYCTSDDRVARMCCQSCEAARRSEAAVEPAPPTTTTTTTTRTKTAALKEIRKEKRKEERDSQRYLCPHGEVSAVWDVPRYKGHFAVATTRNKLFLVSDSGRIRYGNKDLVKYLRSSGFDEPEEPLDAAVTTTLGTKSQQKFQIFFKGETYTLYTGFMRKHSGPHSIHDASGPLKTAFPSYVTKVNAAMSFRSKDGKLYFFFRHDNLGYYYRYDTKKQEFDYGHPILAIHGFINIPQSGPDAAISSKRTGKTYFIAKNDIYKMDEDATVMFGYPRPLGLEFMRCFSPSDFRAGRSKVSPISFFSRLLYALGKIDKAEWNVVDTKSVELDDD